MIVHELRTAEIVPYKTTLIAFINCILVATEELEERVRLRNQFIGNVSIMEAQCYFKNVTVKYLRYSYGFDLAEYRKRRVPVEARGYTQFSSYT